MRKYTKDFCQLGSVKFMAKENILRDLSSPLYVNQVVLTPSSLLDAGGLWSTLSCSSSIGAPLNPTLQPHFIVFCIFFSFA